MFSHLKWDPQTIRKTVTNICSSTLHRGKSFPTQHMFLTYSYFLIGGSRNFPHKAQLCFLQFTLTQTALNLWRGSALHFYALCGSLLATDQSSPRSSVSKFVKEILNMKTMRSCFFMVLGHKRKWEVCMEKSREGMPHFHQVLWFGSISLVNSGAVNPDLVCISTASCTFTWGWGNKPGS